MRLRVVNRDVRVLHEAANLREQRRELLVVEVTLGDRENRCPLPRLVEANGRNLP